MAERSFGPVVVRRRLGSELRRLRGEAGLSLEQAAREMEVSPSKLSRLENGESPAKLWDVRNLLTLYGVEDQAYRRRAERWVNEGRSQGWWHPYSDSTPADLDHYVSLEAEAAEIRAYSTPFLHGLLQTEAYARALLQATLPEVAEDTVHGLVNVRMRRQEIFFAEGRNARLRVVLDEAALLRRVGDAQVMREQHRRTAQLFEDVALRIRPMKAPPHMAMQGSFTIFLPREDDIDPAVVNLESSFHDAYWEDPKEVSRFVRSFEELEESSLSPEDSEGLVQHLISHT